MKSKFNIYTSCIFFLFFLSLLFHSCCNNESREELDLENLSDIEAMGYPLKPVDIRHVKMTDSFWLPVIRRVKENTISYAIEKCIEEGRLENFMIAGGKMKGGVRGEMPFDDTDVYKVIEGASNSLITEPDQELSDLLDSLIAIIKIGQDDDGYLTTWRTIDPATPPASWVEVEKAERWDYLYMSHELYNAGHLYEAAYTHFKATGKKNFLDIALKNADLIVKTFGEGEGKIGAVPGHEIIETGLIKLYLLTGKKEYLNTAKYFLDSRGNPDTHTLYGPYLQDHVPVISQDELVGHAVRAVYLYAAMVDIAAIYGDSAYLGATNRLWKNMVNKKMYITGGIGSLHDGEQFGSDYELPNLTAYAETCAAIGSVYWNHRMHSLTGNADYFNIIERTLYNGLLSGISLDGMKFFYPNPLESDGEYLFNKGACTRQSWFDCSCCPTNLIRFIPSIPGLIYSKRLDTLYVNIYAANTAIIEMDNNNIEIRMITEYPRNGKIELELMSDNDSDLTIKLRIPGWIYNQVAPGNLYHYRDNLILNPSISVNGKVIYPEEEQGYWKIKRKWKAGDRIDLDLPMTVRQVISHPLLSENKGKTALEYGPLVYAVESIDNEDAYESILISESDIFRVSWNNNLLGGVNIIESDRLRAVPYYTWSNRGVNKMKVWIDSEE